MRKSSSLLALAVLTLCLPQFAHAKGTGSSTKIGLGYASGWPGAAMGPSLRIAMPDFTLGFDAGWTTTSPANTVTTVGATTVTTVPGSATMVQIAARLAIPIKKEKALEVYDAPGIGLELASTGDTVSTTVPAPAGTTGVFTTPGGSTTNFHVFNVLGFAYDLGFFGAPNLKLEIEGGLDLAFGKSGKFGFATSPFSVVGGAFHYYF